MALADQIPTQSGFGPRSEPDDVLAGVDLAGKTAIITGGYSGIGLETTRALAARGVKVVVPVRTPEKARKALADLDGDISTAALDLADLASVRRFGAEMLDGLDRLDLLINNAGIMACPLARVGPGWESQFGINHMGHFALTHTLMPLLQKADGARVIAVSSAAHRISGILWDDIQYAKSEYNKWQAYGQAKTANALFANGLSRRLKASGGLAFSLHPGAIFTPLQRHLPQEEMVALGWINADGTPSEMAQKGFKSPTQGASTTLWAATAPALEGKAGVYCADCDIAPPAESSEGWSGVQPHAADDGAAEKLWTISEGLLAEA